MTAGHDDPCRKCSHKGSYHGMTFCAYKNRTEAPRCDCTGWQWVLPNQPAPIEHKAVRIIRPKPRMRRR